ncbi:MAG: 6-bladed beta-propeller [Candidatus Aminicenantes bacterium]|nr:6-bladed beta-propeller [Candidatus Aminicenantes bacterium]
MIAILLAFALVQPIAPQNPQWKGSVATENGVKIVRNPSAPLYGKLTLDLKEELSIGREDDKNYLFWSVADVQVDGPGNIYVVDMKNVRVQKFDRKGAFLSTIGRKGQGPGEFQYPIWARIDPGTDHLFVRDGPAFIQHFDLDGHPVAKMTWNKVVYDFYPLEGGDILGILDNSSDEDLTSRHRIARLGADGKIIRTLAEFPYTVFMQHMSGGTMVLTTGFELDVHIAKIDANAFVYGFSKDYALTLIDADGKILGRVTKEGPAPSFSDSEKAQFKKIPLPEQKPHFFAILTDSKGRIYVQRNYTHTGKSNVQDAIPKEVDVFSREGYFLYTATLPPNTTTIRDGYLYSFAVDEDKGLETVKRYKIGNWDKILDR